MGRCDGMRSTHVRWLVAILGSAFAIATEVVQVTSGVTPERTLIDVVVGETYLLGGVFAWGRQPTNRTWKLMAALGVAWFVGNLASSSVPLLRTTGIVGADADSVLFNWLVLAYPGGR